VHLLLFEAAAAPECFPSPTGAVAIAPSLAAAIFLLGGAAAKKRLEATEARPAATAQYARKVSLHEHPP